MPACKWCTHMRRPTSAPREKAFFKDGGHGGNTAARVEFEDGATSYLFKWWLCTSCDLKVMPDGADSGVVFSTSETGFSEVFLFNLAHGLVANGSSLAGSALLRDHLVERAGTSRLPLPATKLRAVKTLRQGMMLYLELVVAGIPHRAAVFDEPALADTGGERGREISQREKISLHALLPTTVNATPKIVAFFRALCAETVFPWSTQGAWVAVDLLALEDSAWSEAGLEAALFDPRVRELRLLRGAVACLVPSLAV